ncbi:FkbM family methyltransferase [Arcobacter sp.]|uniref:FkbM family methyltransferase n=1 Tax=Arcobacter sp. TaxID=1872629 RepID=UPI003D151DF5
MNKINTLDNLYIQKSTKFMNILRKFINKEGSNAIFGAGDFGRKVCTKLQSLDYEVECFFDNNHDLDNNIINNLKVFSSKKLSNNISNLIIASTWYPEIVKKLKEENIFKGNIIIIDPWFDIFNMNPSIDDLIKLNNFYLKLNDEESKNTLINVIESRVTFNSIIESPYSQYFNQNVQIEEADVFIDGGAYNGDTVFEVGKNLSNLEIHCFEPEDKNYEELIKNCKESKNKIKINKFGLWKEDSILRFSSSEKACSLGARIELDGDVIINTTSIDKYCNENNVKPNFIKLDVEGAEKEAIFGAKEIIKKYKPKLAIAVYHKYDDLWNIPSYLHEICSSYTFYLGHHSDRWYETILYAVEKEGELDV